MSKVIQTVILELLEARSAEASICPSEVARKMSPEEWRPMMQEVRGVAAKMALEGKLRITQGDAQLDPQDVLKGWVKGPIRLRLSLVDRIAGC
jgi:hypothetical protein